MWELQDVLPNKCTCVTEHWNHNALTGIVLSRYTPQSTWQHPTSQVFLGSNCHQKPFNTIRALGSCLSPSAPLTKPKGPCCYMECTWASKTLPDCGFGHTHTHTLPPSLHKYRNIYIYVYIYIYICRMHLSGRGIGALSRGVQFDEARGVRSIEQTIGPEPGSLAPPDYPLRDPKYHLNETIRPLI